MTLLLMVARRTGEGEREIRSGNWSGWRPTHMMGSKVTGKTLGIVGFGRIGQAMAQRAHHGFGMKIVVHNRSPIKQAILKRYNATQVATLDDLLPQSDFVSLHCPGGAEKPPFDKQPQARIDETRGFFNKYGQRRGDR